MSREIIAALDKLDALFSGPEKWTQGWFERDAHGTPIGAANRGEPVCWCLWGGVRKVYEGHSDDLMQELRATLGSPITFFNDAPERTFADIKKLIAETRARLEAQP